MSTLAINLQALRYRVKEKDILAGVDLEVQRGETFAILGGNGAGKTTLLELVGGMIRPTSGSIEVLGSKARGNRGVAILSDTVPLFPMLRVKEILRYFAAFTGRKSQPEAELIEIFGLEPFMDKLFRNLSKGQRKRVGLYLALVNQPELLIMDEPTSDLDPMVRQRIWHYLAGLKDLTVVFTSHAWEEARDYADRLVFLHEGRLLQEATIPANLLTGPDGIGQRKVVIPNDAARPELLAELPYVRHEEAYHVFAEGRIEELIGRLSQFTLNFSVLDSTLQDAYEYLLKTKPA
ncbi:MAG: ABC transporter ATP-binding protein [Bacteroidota bacterium]